MAIHFKPDERMIAFRIDGGLWMFDEELLHFWTQAGNAIEIHGLFRFDDKSDLKSSG